jgi:hypothetical protein
VTDHRGELENIDLMINFDSIASPLGHHQLFCSGGEDLADYTVDLLRENGLHVQLKREADPFADHFPFTVYEVPSLWFFRENFPGGRWQHHSVHDNLDNVSTSVLMDVVSAVCRLVEDAAMREDLPFIRGLDPGIREKTMLLARTLYAGKDFVRTSRVSSYGDKNISTFVSCSARRNGRDRGVVWRSPDLACPSPPG